MSKPSMIERMANAAGATAVSTTNYLIGSDTKPGFFKRCNMAYTLGTEGTRFNKDKKVTKSTSGMKRDYIIDNDMY